MCVSIPGRVVAVEGPAAVVVVKGVERRYNALLCPDLQVGQPVLVNAGLVLQVLAEDEARDIEALLDGLEPAAERGEVAW